jgi:pimeloyl-[acyl-carrier protein] methyl ester esterase
LEVSPVLKISITFLHGWGMNSAVFGPLLDSLSGRYQAAAVNLPGYDGIDMGHPDFDDQLMRLADQLPGGIIAGWSLGGLYAMGLVERYPERYQGLLLIGSNPCFVQREDWSAAMPRVLFDEFADALAADWQATIRRFIGLQLHGMENARALVRRITGLVVSGGMPHPAALSFGLELLAGQDFRPVLARLTVPAMVVLGRRDKLVPASLCEQLPLINPAVRVECLARSAHAPFLSHEAEFIGLLDEFVESTQT